MIDFVETLVESTTPPRYRPPHRTKLLTDLERIRFENAYGSILFLGLFWEQPCIAAAPRFALVYH